MNGPRRLVLTLTVAAFVSAAVLPMVGCSQFKFVPVKGRVVLKNKEPLTFGVVVFMPDKENAFRKIPRGKINPDGTFELDTEGKAGAPIGSYIVCVRGPNRRINGKDPPPLPFSMKYTDAADSPLKIEVVADPAPGAYELQLGGD